MPRWRSLTRFTMRVAFPHLGQSVLLVVSMTFLRSAVFAIFAIIALLVEKLFYMTFAASVVGAMEPSVPSAR